MKYFIGIDLGTSSVKVILLDSNGQVVSSVTKDYPLTLQTTAGVSKALRIGTTKQYLH